MDHNQSSRKQLTSLENREYLNFIEDNIKMTIEVKSLKNISEVVLNASSKINYFQGSFLRILPKNSSVPIFQNTSR